MLIVLATLFCAFTCIALALYKYYTWQPYAVYSLPTTVKSVFFGEQAWHKDRPIFWFFLVVLSSTGFMVLSTVAMDWYNKAVKNKNLNQFIFWFMLYLLILQPLDHLRAIYEDQLAKQLTNRLSDRFRKWIIAVKDWVSPDYVQRKMGTQFEKTFSKALGSVTTLIQVTVWNINGVLSILVYCGYIVYLAPLSGCWMFVSSIAYAYIYGVGRLKIINDAMKDKRKADNKIIKDSDAFVNGLALVTREQGGECVDDYHVNKRLDTLKQMNEDDTEIDWTRYMFFFITNTMLKVNIAIAVLLYCYSAEDWTDSIFSMISALTCVRQSVRNSIHQYARIMSSLADWAPLQQDLEKLPQKREKVAQIKPEKFSTIVSSFKIEMKPEKPALQSTCPEICIDIDDNPLSIEGTLHLKKGMRAALVGPTGMGKSTIFGLISGMAPGQHVDHTLKLDGKNVQGGFYALTKKVSILCQKSYCDFSKSLAEIIRKGSKDHLIKPNIRTMLIQKVIDMTCLANDLMNAKRMDKWDDKLDNSASGGQQTRLGLANKLYQLFVGVMVKGRAPFILLLDEPDAGISENLDLNDFDKGEKAEDDENMIRTIMSNIYNEPMLKDTCILSIIHHFNAIKDLVDTIYLTKKSDSDGQHLMVRVR